MYYIIKTIAHSYSTKMNVINGIMPVSPIGDVQLTASVLPGLMPAKWSGRVNSWGWKRSSSLLSSPSQLDNGGGLVFRGVCPNTGDLVEAWPIGQHGATSQELEKAEAELSDEVKDAITDAVEELWADQISLTKALCIIGAVKDIDALVIAYMQNEIHRT